MDDTLLMLCKVGAVVAIVWLLVSMYCFLMVGVAARSAVRLMVQWYQDWFDSIFEEGDTGEGETVARTEPARSAAAAPAAPAPEETAVDDGGSPGVAPAASPARPARSSFQRRTSTRK